MEERKIKELRAWTGSDLLTCKWVLEHLDYDLETAKVYMRDRILHYKKVQDEDAIKLYRRN